VVPDPEEVTGLAAGAGEVVGAVVAAAPVELDVSVVWPDVAVLVVAEATAPAVLPGMVAAAAKPNAAVAVVAATSADQVTRFSRRSARSRRLVVLCACSMKAKMPVASATGLGENWELAVTVSRRRKSSRRAR
jgi:hypothetical protein